MFPKGSEVPSASFIVAGGKQKRNSWNSVQEFGLFIWVDLLSGQQCYVMMLNARGDHTVVLLKSKAFLGTAQYGYDYFWR